jgi:hypothetical protein
MVWRRWWEGDAWVRLGLKREDGREMGGELIDREKKKTNESGLWTDPRFGGRTAKLRTPGTYLHNTMLIESSYRTRRLMCYSTDSNTQAIDKDDVRPATSLQLHKYNSLSLRRSLLLHTTTQPLNLGNLIIHRAAGQV